MKNNSIKKHAFVIVLLFMFAVSGADADAKNSSFKDRSGHTITVRSPFKRIISLYGAHTENLFSLGLDKEIIGVSKHEAFPPPVIRKPVFSYHDDTEKFILANPDLILIRPMIAKGYPNFVAKLQDAGIVVVSLQPRTVTEMYSYWKKLGMLTGRESRANEMIRDFKAGLERTKRLTEDIPVSRKKRVFLESIHSRMKTFSPDSIAIFALRTAGGINVAQDAKAHRNTNIASYGKEKILSHADDIDIYIAQTGAMNHVTVRRIKEEPGFAAIKAVRNGQIYIVDEKIISRPTMRLLDGIYEIGRILYPARFNDISQFMNIPEITRADFAEMLVKITNMRIKTPDYRHDIQKRANKKHKYGEFRDVDYMGGRRYKFIETAVYRGVFPKTNKYRFYPDMPLKRQTLAFAIFICFDLPDSEPVNIKDVSSDSPFFAQIQAVVGLGIMNLDKNGRFNPAKPLSGIEVFKAVKLAKEKSLR